MLGMKVMFLKAASVNDSGAWAERPVPKTADAVDTYCLTREAPRPRVAPTTRTLAILLADCDGIGLSDECSASKK